MRFANLAGRGALVVEDEAFDIANLTEGQLPSDPMSLIAGHWQVLGTLVDFCQPGQGISFADDQLWSPVPRPGAIFGLVGNYPPVTLPSPPVPMVFGKFPNSVTGPCDDIRLPDATTLPMASEWTVLEAELAVVIGRGGRRLPVANAIDAIAGFTVAQDITERVHEFGPRGTQLGVMEYQSLKSLGKSFDTFCPLGPTLVTVDELADHDRLDIECRLNGRIVQKASTEEMLMGVAELVSVLSTFTTLRPGDVILTGTPTPLDGQLPRLAVGDVIQTSITGIGALRNRCVADAK